jgi:Zn-dependent peptidase ImmA (M78 family)
MSNYSNRIKEKVHNLLKDNGVTKPPVKVQNIASKLGILVRYEPFEQDISGVLYRDKDTTTIGVNAFHHPNRQRFTIAHEIGHFVLHEIAIHVDKGFRIVLRDTRSSKATDRLEIEANRFAAELLMPEDMFRRDVDRYLRDFENESELNSLADRYQVSRQAMALRLRNFALHP